MSGAISSCTFTFFKNTEITLYSFRSFQNSGSIIKGISEINIWKTKKSFENTFSRKLFFIFFQIDKSGIHKTCPGKDVLKIFQKE